jgi:hypothetical protein
MEKRPDARMPCTWHPPISRDEDEVAIFAFFTLIVYLYVTVTVEFGINKTSRRLTIL